MGHFPWPFYKVNSQFLFCQISILTLESVESDKASKFWDEDTQKHHYVARAMVVICNNKIILGKWM